MVVIPPPAGPKSSRTRTKQVHFDTTAPTNATRRPLQPILPAYKRRSRIVSDAQNKLKAPPRGLPTWQEENVAVLSENIGQLIRSAESSAEVEQDRIDADRVRRRAAENEAKIQNRAKRMRVDVDGSDTEDEGEEPSVNGPEPGNQKRVKKMKFSSNGRANTKLDLVKLAPQPIRIAYQSHPHQDRNDAFYITSFRQLYRKLATFSEAYFGVHDLGMDSRFTDPWAEVEVGPEFIAWAGQVAEGDPECDGWDALLRDTAQRKWLVMAMVMRVLRLKIFEVDLWGADEEEQNLLNGIDRSFLDREGFERQELRSAAVRTILGGGSVTKNFYSEVAQLTAQVSILLKPLSDYLYCKSPRDKNTILPTFEDQYQSLHNIISTAAFLSICMRLSPTIFLFDVPTLGEQYDPDTHWNLEMKKYNESRAAVHHNWELERADWLEDLQSVEAKMQKLIETGREDSRKGRRVAAELEEVRNDSPPTPEQTHIPMAKMTVWPHIVRYKPGSDDDDISGVALERKDGMRLVLVSKAAVVAYLGNRDRSEKIYLDVHVAEKKRELARKNWGPGSVAATVLAVATAGWVCRDMMLEGAALNLGERLNAFVEYANNVR